MEQMHNYSCHLKFLQVCACEHVKVALVSGAHTKGVYRLQKVNSIPYALYPLPPKQAVRKKESVYT